MLDLEIVALCAGLIALPVGDEPVRLTLLSEGLGAKVGYYSPQRAVMVEAKPEGVNKAPEGLTAPMYGTLGIGPGYVFVLDEPTGKPARLFVDTNRNGDLTDDPATVWEGKETTKDDKTFTQYGGSFKVDLGNADKPMVVAVKAYRFDKADPAREALKSMLLFYRDYAYEGSITIAGKAYTALLCDDQTRGDFTGKGVNLLVDLNGNGTFESQGERFDATKPFNIAGTTWELADMAKDGGAFRIVKSTKVVAPVAPAPNLSVGSPAIAFEAMDVAGKKLAFPGDYAGKIVLLDFWATWCAPCMAEMPNVVAAYEKFNKDGFEILGISLDNSKSITRLPEVVAKSKMTWRQVADAKGWQAEIGQKYGVMSIPAAYLVDGSTGKILGSKLRGKELEDAIVKALADRKK